MGCAVRIPVDVETGFRDRSSALVVGRSDREAVHAVMGRPRIESRFWRVEVFRDSRRQYEVGLVLLMPVYFQTDLLHRYTVVAYGDDDVVEGLATGVLRENSWALIDYDHLNLSLRTAELGFAVGEGDGLEVLTAEPARWRSYIELPPAGQTCTIILGCTGESFPPYPPLCGVDVTSDDGQLVSLPRSGSALAALRLRPGEHAVTISHRTKRAWKATTRFRCEEGATLHVIARAQLDERASFWTDVRRSRRVNWTFDTRPEASDFFVGRALVVYHGGRWCAEPTGREGDEP
jgi:hypothetical protein